MAVCQTVEPAPSCRTVFACQTPPRRGPPEGPKPAPAAATADRAAVRSDLPSELSSGATSARARVSTRPILSEVPKRIGPRCLRRFFAIVIWTRSAGPVRRLALAGVLGIGLAGCGLGATSAAPPTIICGHVLSRSAAGIGVDTIWGRDARDIVRYPTIDGLVWVKVATGCSTGSVVRIHPSGILRIVKTVRATDGGLVVVVVAQVHPGRATITASHDGHVVGAIQIQLQPESSPPSP